MTIIEKNLISSDKWKRIKIVVTGFLVFAIPIVFLCFQINNLYNTQKEELKIDLRKEILSASNKLKENLIPYNYLQLECSKIHTKLFPNFQKETTARTIEDSYAENLYTEKKLNHLVSLLKEKYSPILITFGTNNLKDFYAYYSPELEKQFESKIDKKNFLYGKAFIDTNDLIERYTKYFENQSYLNIEDYANYIKKNNINPKKLCYKYLSRFFRYNLNKAKIYSDYFNKQILYNIIRYSFTKKGIHGYYSILIPQSSIDPEKIIDFPLKNNQSKVNIELINKKEKEKNAELIETQTGYEYYFEFPTELINQIRIYKWLTNNDKTGLLSKCFKLSKEYPKRLKDFEYFNLTFQLLTFLAALIYISISLLFIHNKNQLFHFSNIKVTQKLVFILSIITFIPITETGIFILLSTQNFNNLIDYNVSKNLRNEINNIYIKNQENDQHSLVSIFELKRKIKKAAFYPEMKNLTDGILSIKDESTWFRNWNTKLAAISDDGTYYSFRNGKGRQLGKETADDGVLLRQYANNLGILKNKNTSLEEDITSSLTLSVLEKYISLTRKEQSVGQESIPHKNVISFIDTRLGNYFYAIDSKKQELLLLNLKWRLYQTYKYLTTLKPVNNIPWYKPQNKFSEIDLGVSVSEDLNLEEIIYYPNLVYQSHDVYEITKKSLENKDSGQEIIKSPEGSLIKQWIFTDNNPFIIGGIARSNYKTSLQLSIYMIFPLLLSYAVLLLILIMGFISPFIKQPINIYNEGLSALENNSYGTTIESFSKDEFNYITKAFNEMSEAIKQKYQISRYVSDKLIQSVSQNKIQEAGTGKQEKVTIISSDIRNFTGTSEKYEPSAIVEMLNTYFTKMQIAITDNGGIIDKYIGDAIQAVFYDDPDKENQVIRAAKAAIAMRKALKEFNEERESKGLFTIENGIGIDTDFAITGTIGTADGRKDFSVNGDVIARAAELEAKTKRTISKILLSKASLEELCPQKPLLEEGNKRGGDLTRVKPNSMDNPLSQEEKGYRVQDIGRKGNVLANDSLLQNRHCEPSLDGVAIQKYIENTLSLNKICSSSVTSQSLRDSSPQVEPLGQNNHIPPITNHLLQTTHNSEAQASLPLPSSLYPKNMDCHENKTVYNTSLVYQDFDENSVELLDVRE